MDCRGGLVDRASCTRLRYSQEGNSVETLTISLPESMRTFIESQVAEGGYDTASEYIQALLREAQKRKAKEKVEGLLLEGLQSGESVEMSAQDWEDIRQEVRHRHARQDGP